MFAVVEFNNGKVEIPETERVVIFADEIFAVIIFAELP